MHRDTVSTYRISNSNQPTRWARDACGRLLLPNTEAGARRLDRLLGALIAAGALLIFCLDW